MSRFTLILLLFASNAGADLTSQLNDVSGSSQFGIEQLALPRPTSEVNAIELQDSQYINSKTPSYQPGAKGQNSSVILKLDDRFDFKSGLGANLKITNEYSADENWNYLDVLDAHADMKIGDNSRISAGRKLYTWSDFDTEWDLGIFQPRYTENGLRPKQAGFTGAFYDVQNDHLAFTAAAMPVFIPDLGPHFSVQNDELVSKNPWFYTPPAHFELTDTNPPTLGNIHYTVADHDALQYASHPGAASKVEFHQGGYSSRVAYAYKPINQYVVSFPSNHAMVVPSSGGDYMMISVTPRVVYERVTSVDQKLESGAWTFSGGAAYDSPVKDSGVDSSTSQQLSDAWIVSGSISRRLEDAGPTASSVEVGFLKVNGGDADASGRFAGDGSIFGRRFQYYEAYLLSLKEEFRTGLRFPLDTQARLIYDRMQGGGVVSLSSGMNLSRSFRADLELDFLGLLTSNAPINDGFLSYFRANDRVGLGMSYVF